MTGGGVATDYCRQSPDAVIESRSLVRLTQSEVESIRSGLRVGLDGVYGNDNYVYFVDNYGNPLAWSGFNGFANNLTMSPYLTCPLHTQDTIFNFPTQPGDDLLGGDNGNIIYPGGTTDGTGSIGGDGIFNGGITAPGEYFPGQNGDSGNVIF